MRELYHSSTYYGKDVSDGLKHYKYIYKKRVNGKWRYYYDIGPSNTSGGLSDYSSDNRQVKGYNLVEDLLGFDERDRMERTAMAVRGTEKQYRRLSSMNTMDDQRRNQRAYQNYVSAGKEFTAARDAFNKTPIGMLSNATDTIKKGAKAVSNFFSKIGNKIKSYF